MRTTLWIVAVCACAVVAPPGLAQPAQPAEQPRAELPEGLRHVPTDAMAFLHFRVGDFLSSEAGTALLKQLSKHEDTAKVLKEIEKHLGVAPADLESVTLLMLEPPAGMFKFGDQMGGKAAEPPAF